MIMERTKEEQAEYMAAIADVLLMMFKELGVDEVLDPSKFDHKRKTEFLGFMVINFDKREMKEESDYIKNILGIKSLEEMNMEDMNMNFNPADMLVSINKRIEQ